MCYSVILNILLLTLLINSTSCDDEENENINFNDLIFTDRTGIFSNVELPSSQVYNFDYAPIISTKSGQVQGFINKTEGLGLAYFAYLGIPYAEPPIGNLRFKDPKPVKPWLDIKQSLKEGNICLQKELLSNKIIGSEDCLFLNVYVPNISNSSAKLPVMFYIHGGFYSIGSSNRGTYGPDYLLEQNVIIVTTNYRLGPLGFLSTQTLDAPGNAGLKDSILALKWVNDNIEQFGGDSKKITIFGESAGGAMIHFLILSPLTKGLFQTAIIESGVALARWSISYKHKHITKKLAKKLKCYNTNSTILIENLQNIDATEILQESFKPSFLLKLGIHPLDSFPYNPCVEIEHANAVITKLPYEIITEGSYNKVPMIFGFNSREGLIIYEVANIKLIRKLITLKSYIPPALATSLSAISQTLVNIKIKKEYYPMELYPNFNVFTDLISDIEFVNPIYKSAQLHAKNEPNQVFLYEFSFEGNISVRNREHFDEKNYTGAPHAEEVGYIWRPWSYEQNPNEMDTLTRQRLVTLFTDFAKYGNPTPTPKEVLQNISWPSMENEMSYIDINSNLKIKTKPNQKKMSFWNNLYKEFGKPPFISY